MSSLLQLVEDMAAGRVKVVDLTRPLDASTERALALVPA